jgi:hypothetical protein
MIEIKEIAHFTGRIKFVAWFYGDKLTVKGEVSLTSLEAVSNLIIRVVSMLKEEGK